VQHVVGDSPELYNGYAMGTVDKRTLQEATRRLVNGFSPQRIILFGSQARGTADARSDVDLLVVLPVHGRRRRLIVEMDRALNGLGIARDIVVLTPREFERDRAIPGTVARPAAAEGRVLYERQA
jgi:predicted nucleotidyltransferase